VTDADKVSILEDKEYSEAIEELIKTPAFTRFIVRWSVEYGYSPTEHVSEARLTEVNFKLGSARPINEFMAGLEEARPEIALKIKQEERKYHVRRSAADKRDRDRNASEYDNDD